MFTRILKESFTRQARTKALAVITLALGASIATALINISLDIGDRMTEELKQYGANILVVPKARALPIEIDGVSFDPLKARAFIEERYLPKFREIFWRYNVKAFTPYLIAAAEAGKQKLEVVGTWFEKENTISTGETFIEGMKRTRPWLKAEGGWIDDKNDHYAALVNEKASHELSVSQGESIDVTLYGLEAPKSVKLFVKGILIGDDAREARIYVNLKFLQTELNLSGKVQEVEVSAITTPDNEISKKAADDSDSLSSEEFEKWYCTAYVSVVAYQIEEVIPGVSAKPIRKVADAEGNILKKLKALMMLLTILALIGSALGIWSLMTTAVLERRREIGLEKALGADSWTVVSLFLAEVVIISVFASLSGWAAGLVFSEAISRSVFGHPGTIKPVILPFVFLLTTGVAILGSLSPIRIILRLRPIEVLHGK